MTVRRNTATSVFEPYQELQTFGARDFEFMQIPASTCPRVDSGDSLDEVETCTTSMLVVANHQNDEDFHDLDSEVFVWNHLTRKFDHFAFLPSIGVRDWEYFNLARGAGASPTHYLVSANNKLTGTDYSVPSNVFASIGDKAEGGAPAELQPCP